jgi:hypothetical protein
MNAQNVSKYKSRSEGDVDTSTMNDIFTWEVDVCLNDLMLLINEIIEINSHLNRFMELTFLLKEVVKQINYLMKNLKIDFSRVGSLNNKMSVRSAEIEKHISDRPSLTSFNSKEKEKLKDQSALILKDLVSLLNKFFVPPYIYILYSNQFRSIFNIKILFDREKIYENEEYQFESGEGLYSNSNKSILENLLN